jgi:AP-1 complex subunit beta-1
LEELDEPEAKASLIWIIGEYAAKINNADELLGIFVDTFTEESYTVNALLLLPTVSALQSILTVDRFNYKR